MTGYQSKKLMAQSRNPEPDDLVKRLQKYLDGCPPPDGRTFHLMHEETLIAESKERIEALRSALQSSLEACGKATDRIEALEAALREIACDQSVSPCTCVNERECSYGIARAALAGEKKDLGANR